MLFVRVHFFVLCFCHFKQHLCEDGEKYVPPPVRRAEETVDAQKQEERERLKKRIKGLLNR